MGSRKTGGGDYPPGFVELEKWCYICGDNPNMEGNVSESQFGSPLSDAADCVVIGLDYVSQYGTIRDVVDALLNREIQMGSDPALMSRPEQQVQIIVERLQAALKVIREENL